MSKRSLTQAIICFLAISLVLIPVDASASQTHMWDFTTATDYTYNQASIALVGGVATLLKPEGGSYPAQATIDTTLGITYQDLEGFSAETTGTVRFQVSKNGAAWYALKTEGGQGWAQSNDASVDQTDSATDLDLVIPTFLDEFGTGDLYIRAVLFAPENDTDPAPTISSMTLEYVGETTPQQCFLDVATNHPDFTAICDLKTRGIISGVDANSFFPNVTVRRGEAFKIALGGRDVSAYAHAENPFVDLPSNHTLKAQILYLFHNNVISGYDATHVGPDNPLTEAEATKVILNLNGILTASPTSGQTYGMPSSSTLIDFVHTAFFKNLLRGGNAGFIHDRGMTRGKIANMMYRVLIMNEAGASVYAE